MRATPTGKLGWSLPDTYCPEIPGLEGEPNFWLASCEAKRRSGLHECCNACVKYRDKPRQQGQPKRQGVLKQQGVLKRQGQSMRIRRPKAGTCARLIMDMVKEHPDMRSREIAEQLGCSQRTACNTLSLIRQGVLK
ncbi:hypothetical protein [Desulfuromonas thiophila]|uniref:hypothetical protein n=1 Tax=Desulfuromonas thiophila TaxID=57664 RepID=UPI0029F4C468|nr:hypothetical protein [Desulfuromonas thiophila]